MDDHDKIYDKIKDAAHNAESREFAAMEKVWGRVQEKLDKKVLKKQNKLWKKFAIAASVLLLASLGYQFFRTSAEQVEAPVIEVVTIDTVKSIIPQTKSGAVVSAGEIQNPQIRKDAKKVLQDQISIQQTLTMVNPAAADPSQTVMAKDLMTPEASKMENASTKSTGTSDDQEAEVNKEVPGKFSMETFEARSVQHDPTQTQTPSAKKEIRFVQQEIPDPLVVFNGNAVTGEPAKTTLSKLTADQIESIEVLNEPLYIINGEYYSEKELFGIKPTSPYAPLNQQEITSISILQGLEATSVYGKKGEKGVVVITTKNKKPAPKK